jgi:hypothetical protein
VHLCLAAEKKKQASSAICPTSLQGKEKHSKHPASEIKTITTFQWKDG